MMANELGIPNFEPNDPNALQLASVWAANGRSYICLRANIWDDPAAWGIMLADIARHAAQTFENAGRDKVAALNRVIEGFEAELSSESGRGAGQ